MMSLRCAGAGARGFLAACLCAPLSLLWGAAVWVRNRLFDCGVLRSRTFGLPVICVGNLAVGGTGKTPHVEYLLRLLHGEGLRVAMLSRGYGRHTRGYVLADAGHTARDIGDEPFQISRNCPFAVVAVCERRATGIAELLKLRPQIDVIVLDDAYQHRHVCAGFNLLLTDAARLYTHDRLLPWGRLREPASEARRAHAVVVTKCADDCRPALPVAGCQRLFYSRIVYGECYVPERPAEPVRYAGRRVLLLAGIANPLPLQRFLQSQGAEVVEALAFPDHHDFAERDLRRIRSAFRSARAEWVVTTQKDMARLSSSLPMLPAELRERLVVQPISVEVAPARPTDKPFNQTIVDYVRTNSRNCRLD